MERDCYPSSLGVRQAEWCEPGSKGCLMLQDLHETILCCIAQYASGVSEGWEVGYGHGFKYQKAGVVSTGVHVRMPGGMGDNMVLWPGYESGFVVGLCSKTTLL
jgi:hypothetical protein